MKKIFSGRNFEIKPTNQIFSLPKLTPQKWKITFFGFWETKNSDLHINVKRLTKLGFGHVSSIFKPLWPIYIDMENPCKNENYHEKWLFLSFSWKYLICGFNLEIYAWKYFFQKVQMILYILAIYHFFSSCVLKELCLVEDTRKTIRFGQNHSKNSHLRVYRKDSMCLGKCLARCPIMNFRPKN